jgi:hypothetical protein
MSRNASAVLLALLLACGTAHAAPTKLTCNLAVDDLILKIGEHKHSSATVSVEVNTVKGVTVVEVTGGGLDNHFSTKAGEPDLNVVDVSDGNKWGFQVEQKITAFLYVRDVIVIDRNSGRASFTRYMLPKVHGRLELESIMEAIGSCQKLDTTKRAF